VDVVGLPEFLRCLKDAARTEGDERSVDGFLHRLASEHSTATMRASSLRIEGTDIQLRATGSLLLSGGIYRITWRYERRHERL